MGWEVFIRVILQVRFSSRHDVVVSERRHVGRQGVLAVCLKFARFASERRLLFANEVNVTLQVRLVFVRFAALRARVARKVEA